MNKLESNYSFFVGIDMSKLKFDASIIELNGKKLCHKFFNNNADGFVDFLSWVYEKTLTKDILFIMEHTGIFSRLLWFFLQDNSCDLCMESGYIINRSAGIKKGKSDKLDAYMIANYGLEKRNKLRITPVYDEKIFVLHDLLSNRNRLKDQLKALETPLKELKKYATNMTNDIIHKANEKAISGLKESLSEIESEIDKLIDSTPEWKENIKYASSVKGIGKTIVCWMIVYTRNFSDEFTARKFASMAGIAPFGIKSGTSIKKGDHVSHFSHKFLKGVLHLAAMSAIQHNPKIKEYYKKKKEIEGKKGFVVLNNVKNKLVQTVFSLVRTKAEFDDNFQHKLAA